MTNKWDLIVELLILAWVLVIAFAIGHHAGKLKSEESINEFLDSDTVLLDECQNALKEAREFNDSANAILDEAKKLIDAHEYYIPTSGYELPDALTADNLANESELQKSVCLIAQTLWGECRGMSKYEQSMVAWCILNRVDNPRYPDSIEEVIKQPGQFHGYSENNPIDDLEYQIALDVVMRWSYEAYTIGDVGRTLPEYYTCFYGKDGHNWFRNEDKSLYYRFTADDPYGDNVLTFDYISNVLGGNDE